MEQHSLRVLHFGGQCPWHLWVIEQAQKAAVEVGGVVEIFDVMEKPEPADRYRLFSPFMTVIDEKLRLSSPTSAERLVAIIKGGMSSEFSSLRIFDVDSPAPKITTTAFITCLYSLSENGDKGPGAKLDYRGSVLEHSYGYL